ncbi:hypothetical protein D1227_07540 [Henriciella mobilis]|uniref:DUF6680 family protein n=1 Tax=Henriciella mobilis TaxID=2305467 RepID=UPI000E673D30|nr:DUF6680 family protein [Henriciella mobilis]RIJ22600.1 hypothetical protein D1227_07540 [Henriciella mobilis]
MIATIVGPLAAVGITLWYQGATKKREQQLVLLRMLSATRGLPGDLNHSAALTLVPVEFADSPIVMARHKAYLEAISKKDSDGNLENPTETVNKYHDLLQSIFEFLGYKFDHEAVRNQGVLTKGFIDRDNLYLDSLRASIHLAESARVSAIASARMANHVAGPPEDDLPEISESRSDDPE